MSEILKVNNALRQQMGQVALSELTVLLQFETNE